MVTGNTQGKSAVPDFFVKNWAKLISFRHRDYMWSRISVAVAGSILTVYFTVDAFYFHKSDGELIDVIYLVGIIMLMAVLRKTFLRLLQLRDTDMTPIPVEPPNKPDESRWVRLGFRLPFGQRRGLSGFISRTSEAYFISLIALALIGKCVRHGVFQLPVFIPTIFSKVTFPAESWYALAIIEVALVISWLNNSIFLVKYEKVRKTIIEAAEKMLIGKSPLRAVGLEMFEYFQEKGVPEPSCRKEVLATETVARFVIALYGKNNEETNAHLDVLSRVLVEELDRHEYTANEIPALFRFLDKELSKIKKGEKQ